MCHKSMQVLGDHTTIPAPSERAAQETPPLAVGMTVLTVDGPAIGVASEEKKRIRISGVEAGQVTKKLPPFKPATQGLALLTVGTELTENSWFVTVPLGEIRLPTML